MLLVLAILVFIINLTVTILVPYVIAAATNGKSLKLSHLVVCMVIFLVFDGMIVNMAIFYCLFKMIGIGLDEKILVSEKTSEEPKNEK